MLENDVGSMSKDRNRWFGLLPAVLVMAAIFILSHQEKPPSLGNDPELSAMLGHLVAYGVLAAAMLAGLVWIELPFRQAAVAAIGMSVAFGITDELHQRFVPGRHADPWDLLADLIGATVAVGIVALLRIRATTRWPPTRPL